MIYNLLLKAVILTLLLLGGTSYIYHNWIAPHQNMVEFRG
jgi:hypothetical protein